MRVQIVPPDTVGAWYRKKAAALLEVSRFSRSSRFSLCSADSSSRSAEALDRLAAIDRRKGRAVELRYFGGLNVEETAETLGVSVDTVKRDWRLARA
jgi:DNA-directed RNA polymerase specialized sigma24 family protein